MAGPWEKYAQQPSAPMTVGNPRPEKPPAGYQSGPGGLAPLPGGPADKPETSNLPTGWERPSPRSPAQRIPGLPAHVTDPKSEGDAKLTEGERTGAGFYRRAYNAHRLYGEGILPRNPVVQGVIDVLPDDWENALDGPERRAHRNYAEEFIRAKLRKESGATITPQEMESEFRVYFPVPGDTRADLDRKARLREEAIAGLRIASGASADQALEGLDEPLPANNAEAELEQRIARGDDPRATVDWLFSVGRPPTPDQIDRIYQNYRNPRPDVRPPEGEDPRLRQLGVGVGGVLQGVGDVANLVSSPFISAVNAATGSNFNPDMGANLRNVTGTPDPQGRGENLAYQISRFGTGALNLAGAARSAAPYVAGSVGNALARFGSAPLTDAVAGSSAGASSELTRQAGGGPILQTIAGLSGGAISLPVSGRVNALMEPPAPPPAVVRAGQQEGVTVNRAMVDPRLQAKTIATGKTFVGSKMMHRGMEKSAGRIEGRVRSLGQGENLKEPAAVGATVQGIGRRYIKASGEEFRQKYGSLRTRTANVQIDPTETTAHIDSILARLNKAPGQNAAEIKYLETVKSDIAKGIDVETARDIGSRLGRDIAKGDVTFGPHEAAVLDVRKALARDTENGLTAAGKQAEAAQYRELDAAYSQRMNFIKQKLQNLVGKRDRPLDAEKAAGRLSAMAGKRGDASGLFQVLKKATPEELEDVRSTFAHQLGRNKDGGFSTAKLVSDLDAMPAAARIAIFGKDGAKSLENLKMIAAEHKRVMGSLGGSPTALAQDWRGYLYNLILGPVVGGAASDVGTGAVVAVAGVGLKAARDAVSARALLSPKITGWLRSAPRTTDPKAINAHFDRLKAIAAREPALAPEIENLQQLIMRAANENASQTGQVAASPNERPKREAER